MKLNSLVLIALVCIVSSALGRLVCTDEGYCIHCSKSEMVWWYSIYLVDSFRRFFKHFKFNCQINRMKHTVNKQVVNKSKYAHRIEELLIQRIIEVALKPHGTIVSNSWCFNFWWLSSEDFHFGSLNTVSSHKWPFSKTANNKTG